MARQYFTDGPFIDPPIANGTALVATTAEALWLGASFTPIFANDPKAGKIYHIVAGGLITTNTTGTLILAPQYGVLGGTALGASVTQTVVPSLTNVPWTLELWLVFRTIGAAGANSTCIATGTFSTAGAAATAGSAMSVAMGGTSAAVDATINSAITISKTLSVAGSMTTQYAFIHSLN